MTEEMPSDPFETGSGFAADLVAEGDLLRGALDEALDRGQLFEALNALNTNELRAYVLASLLATRFRGRFEDPEDEDR